MTNWRQYISDLFRVALPIVIQQFIMTSLNVVDVLMIGQLGESAVAAVGLANQISFLLMLLMFGASSGAAIFTAQYWGKNDVVGVRRVLGICVMMALAGSTLFGSLALLIPKTVLGVYSQDAEVITLGSQYLRQVAPAYFFMSITVSYAFVSRSTGHVRLPMVTSIVALSLNTLLNYSLIFGNFGLPALGVQGAALATLISRFVECALILGLTYIRRTPAAARIKEMIAFNRAFLAYYLKKAMPVVANEIAWSLGITFYNVIYAHISTESIAAYNIVMTIEQVAFVLFIGIGNGCAIVVGNLIGAGHIEKAFNFAKQSILLAASGAMLIGVTVALAAPAILRFYQISETANFYARSLMLVSGSTMFIKATNFTTLIGAVRSGGDTRFAMMTEMVTIWGVGVPLALIGAFVLHLPVYWVYLMVNTEELCKCIISVRRFISRRWINRLVEAPEAVATA